VTTSSRPLATTEDIPDRTARGFEPRGEGEHALFVVRRGNALYAYRDRCPHQGARMAWRRHAYLNGAGDRIVCYAHGAEFDIASGRCLLGPCIGQSLEPLNLEITERGEIYVKYEPADGHEHG
jgi:nitrite reductase/ring-hydroxylating ferredoxin subunit